MKKLLALVLTVAAALSLATVADAKTPANVRTYGDVPYDMSGVRVSFGQVFSKKRECYSKRDFRFAVQTKQGKQFIDGGATSLDGAISAGYDSELVDGRDLYYVLSKTKHCASETVAVETPDPLNRDFAKPPVRTIIVPLGLNGFKQDGAFAGLVGLNKQARCFDDRKTKLVVDGEVVDRGTTSFGGSWALHLLRREFKGGEAKLTVKVAKSKLPNGTVCAGDSLTLGPTT